MLPLDCHAHIQPSIPAVELRKLGGCVIAVTRSLDEFAQVVDRRDGSVVWALGVHPGLRASQDTFTINRFRELLPFTPVIGEIGLDRRSQVPLELQQQTLDEILSALDDQPRMLSIHSNGATSAVLDLLAARRPRGVVLHWWRGTVTETLRALDLGCSFSINAAEVANPRVLGNLPRERILTETDHPYGDRRQAGKRPGRVDAVEAALARQWNVDLDAARRQVWANFLAVATTADVSAMMPPDFQRTMLAA